ncbi:Rhodanese-like protein [Artomyces pyxidatus]|uniref:Rhodanese-like protein n=1 Tax=Artomyces pyxidatus TaxID=48021 RepID=A0ACB8SKP3_9AGAM|nr:Rhodanese-like protein [Artomyces pyxidatus]
MVPKYISGDELEALIKSDKRPHRDYLIVDVRDDDYAGGNIANSHNLPSETFHAKVDELVTRTKDVPMVIFHCALSQARGPKAARIYAQAREHSHGKDDQQEVLILRGGFNDFQAKYKDDPLLVENWDPEVWAREWS